MKARRGPKGGIPHERAWNVGLRTVHLMAFGLLLGGHAWEIDRVRLAGPLWVTILSGAALMGLELRKSFEWLFLGKGVVILVKLGLLLLVPIFWEARLPLLLLVVVIASIGSHMPSRFRYYSFLRRRIVLVDEPGIAVAPSSEANGSTGPLSAPRRSGRRGLLPLLLASVVGSAVPALGEEAVTLFVVSETNDIVSVYRGMVPDLRPVRSIKVGREPHNLGISPDGLWVATSDRRSGEVSVIDTRSLTEAPRLKLGRQTHDVAFTSDSRTLFVGHETENFVSVIEVGTWKVRAPLKLGRAQHYLSLSFDDKELWFTVTNRPYKAGDPRVGVVDLATARVTLIDTGANAHDVTLSPDGKIAWVTNSGFTHLPDPRVDLIDVVTRKPLGWITVGKYPFHSPKRGRDGNAVPTTAPEMWFSDHGLQSVLAVSLADRRVVAKVPVGVEPYHVAATATGTLFVANHTSSTVTIIDGPRREVLGTLKVPPRPHGLAVLAQQGPAGAK